MNPWDLWRWLAVASAAGALALGLAIDLPRRTDQPTEPAWAAHLSPLRQAPLVRGTPVPLILPGGLAAGDGEKLLMEAVWQLAVAVAGIPRLAAVFDPVRMVSRAEALSGAVAATVTPVLLLEVLLAAVVLTSPASPNGRPLKVVLILWLAALGLAYLVSPHDLDWHVRTSLERVLAIPLPGALGLVLGIALGKGVRAASRAIDSCG